MLFVNESLAAKVTYATTRHGLRFLDIAFISADRQQLRQIFLNRIMNASDAMPQGGTLTIHIAMGVLETGALAVVIEFADTGVGIAPEP